MTTYNLERSKVAFDTGSHLLMIEYVCHKFLKNSACFAFQLLGLGFQFLALCDQKTPKKHHSGYGLDTYN